MAAKPKLHWDSCIFFAWLNDERAIHGDSVMDGINEMASRFDENRVVLMSSLITKVDVFDNKLKTQWARDEFSARFQRDNFMWILQDERVTDRSRAIRDFYSKKGITLDATDCVQLASAILYKADVFYTLDGNSNRPKPNGLLKLDGDVAGHKLRIIKPFKEQPPLFREMPQAVSAAVKPIAPKRPPKTIH
ncbi:MAG: PIN domain-containing protein [Bryobacterales bacterium]|nr:PIN domain-containing protein [Bryobacterales bacterium]